MNISGPAALALNTLSPSQVQFLQSIPKAELHAHLNGSIPLTTLKELAAEYLTKSSAKLAMSTDSIKQVVEALVAGPSLEKVTDFFGLFPAIYALTSTPAALSRATQAVLSAFLDGDVPQCQYLELRTTPRETEAMDREKYLRVVLAEIKSYRPDQVALIVSLDRRMNKEIVHDCVGIASELKAKGERVVGIDLCGDPTTGNMDEFVPYLLRAKEAGLGVTLHIAETARNTREETLKLLSCSPDRLGHATFLKEEAISVVLEKKMCIEICLSSNLLCNSVPTLGSHHIQQYLKANHPITICTDDILPFKTSLLGEYAILLAQPPYGLGLEEEQVKKIANMGINARFQ